MVKYHEFETENVIAQCCEFCANLLFRFVYCFFQIESWTFCLKYPIKPKPSDISHHKLY